MRRPPVAQIECDDGLRIAIHRYDERAPEARESAPKSMPEPTVIGIELVEIPPWNQRSRR